MSDYTLSNFRVLPATPVEALTKMVFDEDDVLTHSQDIRVRHANIDKAIALAKSSEYTTSIIVKTIDGILFKIVADIKSHEPDYVHTANNLKIPVKAIYSVDFYKG